MEMLFQIHWIQWNPLSENSIHGRFPCRNKWEKISIHIAVKIMLDKIFFTYGKIQLFSSSISALKCSGYKSNFFWSSVLHNSLNSEFNILRISADSLLTIVPLCLSHRTGTLYLPSYPRKIKVSSGSRNSRGQGEASRYEICTDP